MAALCPDCLYTLEHISQKWESVLGKKIEHLSDRVESGNTLESRKIEKAILRCPSCGSPRIITHNELFELTIAHIDCDAFYASIEKRDNPDLQDKPVIIGGGRRGVVSTACYLARISGVHSAMPMFKALEACPNAVVIRPNMEKYTLISEQIRHKMRALTPLVEPLSIDEAFLDLAGTKKLHHKTPAEVLAAFALDIEKTVGISLSIGLAPNKFLAKIASDLQKPRGFSIIGASECEKFLANLSISTISGVGKSLQKQLEQHGYRKIVDLQQANQDELIKKFGAIGQNLAQFAKGQDTRSVTAHSHRKSISAETTFDTDLMAKKDLERHLRITSEKVSHRLKSAAICGHIITLKLKTANFKTRSRTLRLSTPTQLADTIFLAGQNLLTKELHQHLNKTSYRLIGIGVTGLESANIADFNNSLDNTASKRAAAEYAIDTVRNRFGKNAIKLGLIFEPPDSFTSK